MGTRLESAIRRIRPAPVQSALLKMLGLTRRREITFEGWRFYCDPSSNFGHSLANGGYEPRMVEVLRNYLRPNGTFLDLGTNEGFFSVLASTFVGPMGQVISVEPQTRLLPQIQENLKRNSCYNCRVIQCVVSDEDGEAIIHLAPRTNSGATSLFRVTRYPVPTETVPSLTLARLLERCGLGGIDLVKVDIEGAEYSVFTSASEILRTGQLRHIALEYHDTTLRRRGLSSEDLHRHILSCGYRMNDSLGPTVYEFIGQS